MKYSLLLATVIASIFIAACNKDKFTTAPQVKAKTVKPGIVIKGQVITFTSSFTDEEGDVQDSVLVVLKRYNGANLLPPRHIDSFQMKLDPGLIPKARQGDIIVKFGYGETNLPGAGNNIINLETVDREVSFGIIIRDNAGNRSNYAESDKILLKKL